jgi:SAM-dependent methyltransferase
MIDQQPLAYLLGMEGLALLRAYAGEYDREFTRARIAEIRRLLDTAALHEGVAATAVSTVEGYRAWSASYDEPRNSLFDVDEPIVHEILDPLPAGTALDAACGTGRYAEYLAARGHRVIGTDTSAQMLDHARARVPAADFRAGDLHRLPVGDGEVDLVVCALALTHVPDLVPVVAEFARVLRPGGHLVIADVHHALVALGSVPKMRTPDGRPGLLPAYRHLAGDYLAAALPLGLRLLRCAEPLGTAGKGPSGPPAPPAEQITAEQITPGPWDDWPWSLLEIVPAAAQAAWRGTPLLLIWHFQLGDRPAG